MLYHRDVRPKKSLGQHFLKDLSIADQIAHTIDNFPELPVLEIGPGTGVLTRYLLSNSRNLTVVELDAESIRYLQTHYRRELEGRIIQADVLKLDLNFHFTTPFCVIGNYPYNISTQIFFKVLDYRDVIPCCAGMMQKEVAERIASAPGKKTTGILSTLIQTWYNVEYLFTVEPDAFDPPPKVKSAVIRMTRNNRPFLDCDENLYRTLIKTAFNQRRKTMRNSLKIFLGKENPLFVLPVFDRRPEQLSVDDWISLTTLIAANSGT
jgi:16S rRNA (adenine1518-N6/adenine1519-N6)-dimethyltransferase